MPILFKAANTNTGVSTLKINNLTATTIKKNGSSDLAAGDILAGQIISVSYDGTYYQLISPPVLDITTLEIIKNLKLVLNASVYKFDIFARSSGAVPDGLNPIRVPIPDGNGNVIRVRDGQYLSGTSQIILPDGAVYWGRASLPQSQYWACLYAIWDGTGIVWAVSANPHLQKVSTTTDGSDPDYMLRETGSTYVRNGSHYCQMVGAFEYEFNTADSPDHTIEAAGFRVCLTPPKYLYEVGKTSIHWTETPPIGELELNGQSLVIANYRRLFTYLHGPTYGAADSSHFYLPKPSGYFPRVWDHGNGIDPDKASRTTRGDGTTGDHVGTKQVDQIKAHNHVIDGARDTGPSGSTTVHIQTATTVNDQNTENTGGNETRGVNINIMLTIKY